MRESQHGYPVSPPDWTERPTCPLGKPTSAAPASSEPATLNPAAITEPISLAAITLLASAASGNVCPGNDPRESFVVAGQWPMPNRVRVLVVLMLTGPS